ncbi:T9SS type A sorting domain-containing protein [Lewinella sp. W8]|uniref:T9SS type A sorting domain-containing protein n=1 Tax=Lewinella sp. W8 TaxID=2528208 RepID=UPI0010678E4D|nr:T9SS type A sorting domain-containing protein [Lewinella sp. W8]MTB53987.1 T9SS type A sorting domain-containing protein [Lewinella sp. W8]
MQKSNNFFYLNVALLLAFIALAPLKGQGQPFSLRYSFSPLDGDGGRAIWTLEDHYLVGKVSTFVDNETGQWRPYGGLFKTNRKGEVINSIDLKFGDCFFNFDFSNSLILSDSIVIVGRINSGAEYQEPVLLKIDTGFNQSNIIPLYNESFQEHAQYLSLFSISGDSILVVSNIENNLGEKRLFFHTGSIVDTKNLEDIPVYLTDGNDYIIYDVDIDNRGNVYLTYSSCNESNNCIPSVFISKYTTIGEQIWTTKFQPNRSRSQVVVPQTAVLTDESVVLSWTKDTIGFNTQEAPPVFFLLDKTGNKVDSISFHGNIRSVYSISTAEDGSVIASGFARTDISVKTGWIIRIGPNFTLDWERYVLDERDYTRPGNEFFHSVEDLEGNIVAVGNYLITNQPPSPDEGSIQVWFLRLTSEGAFLEDIHSDTIHLRETNSTRSPASDINLELYPNPTSERLYIKTASPIDIKKVEIFSIGGHLTYSYLGRKEYFDCSSLKPGVYAVRVLIDNVGYVTRKFTVKK